jgi:hypothetical protein
MFAIPEPSQRVRAKRSLMTRFAMSPESIIADLRL